MHKKKYIARDISWLSFNERVLQEAIDKNVSLQDRIRFMGIFSNNKDEFFSVRVATLRKMARIYQEKHLFPVGDREDSPEEILSKIQATNAKQQALFNAIWRKTLKELKSKKVFFRNEKNLSKQQKDFLQDYFDNKIRINIIPLMLESLKEMPNLKDKDIYLGIVMYDDHATNRKFSVIEVPVRTIGRFIQLPSAPGTHAIILIEDVIRYFLPQIFSCLNFTRFESYTFKITRDADLDIDNDVSETIVDKIKRGLKTRKRGKPIRFSYDRNMNPSLLNFLISRLKLGINDNVVAGSRIHDFRDFMDFPVVLKTARTARKTQKPFIHPELKNAVRISDIVASKDILLCFPYHSFDSVIDMLREAAMDEHVISIKITAYRLASNSRIINALINACRNGKKVTVMLELRARFDEAANLKWKEKLEEEGVKVVLGIPEKKVHAKLCVITKKQGIEIKNYGFVSTGNLNEKTARIYSDCCLLTADESIMQDIDNVFHYLENINKGAKAIEHCNHLILSPWATRPFFMDLIDKEISNAKKGLRSGICLKMNSLSDPVLIAKLYEAAECGVPINLIIRGIFCMRQIKTDKAKTMQAISIVDQYLEHARISVFHNNGEPRYFLSSADWMVRNLDHRLEATIPVLDARIQTQLQSFLDIQLSDNVKARILEPTLSNKYADDHKQKKTRAQIEIYNYLYSLLKDEKGNKNEKRERPQN